MLVSTRVALVPSPAVVVPQAPMVGARSSVGTLRVRSPVRSSVVIPAGYLRSPVQAVAPARMRSPVSAARVLPTAPIGSVVIAAPLPNQAVMVGHAPASEVVASGAEFMNTTSASRTSLHTSSCGPYATPRTEAPLSMQGLQTASTAVTVAAAAALAEAQAQHQDDTSECGIGVCGSQGGKQSSQLVELLETLEARMDLMSQMQQTRAALQNRQQEHEAHQIQELHYSTQCDTGLEEQDAFESQHQRMHYGVEADYVSDEASPSLVSASLAANDQMWDRFMDQRDSITKLTDQVESMRKQLMALGPMDTQPVQCLGSGGNAGDRAAAAGLGSVPVLPSSGPPLTLPFHAEVRGANVELSLDGYTVSRTRGCRQAAAIGSAPLEHQAHGRYFEVSVDETVAGWVGGLGIGITATPPGEVRRLPDKAWKDRKSVV